MLMAYAERRLSKDLNAADCPNTRPARNDGISPPSSQNPAIGAVSVLALLIVPVGLVEPLKIVALFVAGKGHWLSRTAMIIGAYVLSLFFVERLFRMIKPRLMTLSCFSKLWTLLMALRSKANRWFRVSIEGAKSG